MNLIKKNACGALKKGTLLNRTSILTKEVVGEEATVGGKRGKIVRPPWSKNLQKPKKNVVPPPLALRHRGV